MSEWGDKLDFLYDLESSGISPQALENRPVLHGWMREYLVAFRTLNRTRTMGMAPNPISLVEIKAYLDMYGAFDPEAFVHHIMLMDSCHLGVMATKKVDDPTKTNPKRSAESDGRQKRRPTSSRG